MKMDIKNQISRIFHQTEDWAIRDGEIQIQTKKEAREAHQALKKRLEDEAQGMLGPEAHGPDAGGQRRRGQRPSFQRQII